MRPYSIWAPEWTQRSAGVVALYRLGKLLRERGLACEVGPERTFSDSIAIYPGIVGTNPWKATRVVRWSLGRACAAGRHEQLWSWSVAFLDELNAIGRAQLSEMDVLRVPITETELFNNYHPKPRKGAVYYRAEEMRGTTGMVEITRNWPDRREEMADLLQRSEFLVCGWMSSLADEARFCGCPVVQIGSWKRPRLSDFGLDGVGWGFEELEEARRTVNEALPKYLAYMEGFPARLERFIERTQAMEEREPVENGGYEMKGKVKISFVASLPEGGSRAYRKGEVVEILDWTWVSGGLVEVIPEPETMDIQPGEVSAPAEAKRHGITSKHVTLEIQDVTQASKTEVKGEKKNG